MDLARGRVLLTGGAGFIGSATLWGLNRRGCDRVVVCDVFTADDKGREKERNLAPLRFESRIDASQLLGQLGAGTLGRFDLVLHLGAESSTTVTDVAYLERNNTLFTRDLAAWSLEQGARFVYASSAATYGDGTEGMSDREERLERFRPLNAYGDSKQRFDLLARDAGWLDRIVGLKYFNVFGPNEAHKGDMRSVVAKAYEQIRDSGRLRLFRSHRADYRDGEQKRDFLYVKDAAAMTLHLAEAPCAGLFNLGSGAARTWIDLARAVFSAMDREPAIDFVDMPGGLRAQYQYFTEADISRLREAGYGATVTALDAAVSDYVRNYLAPNRRLEPAAPSV